MQITRVPLRQINAALRLTLPLYLSRKLKLTAWDSADVIEEDNGDVRLRFVKVASPAALEAVAG
jgi:hypothetical protein